MGDAFATVLAISLQSIVHQTATLARGPMSSFICKLKDLHWTTLRTSTRTDRHGRSHCLDFSCGLLQSQVAFVFIESQEEALWQKASRRPGGHGLEQGADLPVARRHLGRSPSNVQALRALVQGSIPSADNSLRDSCPFCQDPHPNLIHMLWQCRELDTVNGQAPLNGYVKLLSRNRHTSGYVASPLPLGHT